MERAETDTPASREPEADDLPARYGGFVVALADATAIHRQLGISPDVINQGA
jgi:hypothetical protein